MDVLRVTPGPGAPRGLEIPAKELVERFSRSSGPGGQHVNTSDTRVQLSLDLATTSALDEIQRERALRSLAPRLAGTVLTVTVEANRSQRRNRAVAGQRLADLLRDAVAPPTIRRPTKPTRGSQRRRVRHEMRRSEIKRGRRRPEPE